VAIADQVIGERTSQVTLAPPNGESAATVDTGSAVNTWLDQLK